MHKDSVPGTFDGALKHKTARLFPGTIIAVFLSVTICCRGQQGLPDPLPAPAQSSSLLTSTVDPGTVFLFGLERNFAAVVAAGGGAAFASFFDKDGVVLANRQPPLTGQTAIAAHSTWTSASYRLTWKPDGGALSSAGDMGYTWGHYEGRSSGSGTRAAVESGRYMTVWKKEPDGSWKVLLDSSNEDAPEAECKCSVNGLE